MQMPLAGYSHASGRGSFLQIWDSLIIRVCVCICEGKRLMLFTCLVHRLKGHFNPLYCDLFPLAPTPKSAKPFSTSYSLQRVNTGYLLFCAPERTRLSPMPPPSLSFLSHRAWTYCCTGENTGAGAWGFSGSL